MTTAPLLRELAAQRAESKRQEIEIAALKQHVRQLARIAEDQCKGLEGLAEVISSMQHRRAVDQAMDDVLARVPGRRVVN